MSIRFDEVGEQRNDARSEAVLSHDAHLELRYTDHLVAACSAMMPRPRRDVQQPLLQHPRIITPHHCVPCMPVNTLMHKVAKMVT